MILFRQQRQYTQSGHSFNSAHTGCHGSFRQYFKQTELSGVVRMGSAAQFGGKFTHFYNAYRFTVFFSEQCQSACSLRGFNICFHSINGERCKNVFIHQFFYLCKLFRREGREMAEVETQPFLVYIGTGLLYMIAQHLPECCLQQMHAGVISSNRLSALSINARRYAVPFLDHAGKHLAYVYKNTVCFFRVQHGGAAFRGCDCAGIADLTAALTVERGFVQDDAAFSLGYCPAALTVHKHCKNSTFSAVFGISGKLRSCNA